MQRFGSVVAARTCRRGIRSFHFISAACSIPHPEKAHTGGEDAYGMTNKLLAVADGVGGWATEGVDSGKFSRKLVRLSVEIDGTEQSPRQKLQAAYNSVLDQELLGSSTATLVQLSNDDKMLSAYNLGDSGYLVYRRQQSRQPGSSLWNIVCRSFSQNHFFNCPLQLGPKTSKGFHSDSPDDGIQSEFRVQPQDIVILATDGVLDNVYEDDIVRAIDEIVVPNNDDCSAQMMQRLADRIGEDARQGGKNTSWHSPFAKSAKEAGYRYKGGKMDDITVIAATVV